MASVFIVMSSNCEEYEDYHEHVESVWSDRASAVRHIESDLGMAQVSTHDPARSWSRDRWLVKHPDYPREEEFADDPEGWDECHDEDGELIPYWVYSTDAWIVEMPLDPSMRGE